MGQQMHSQSISKIEPRVKPVVNTKGDTLIQLKLSDAKIILKDVLAKEVCDSTVAEYIQLDNLRSGTIALQNFKISTLESKFNNCDTMLNNLQIVVKNKNTEITFLNETIKKQNKEILKQKFFKIIGFSAAILIPITFLLIAK
jgi:hypothetical protein